MLTNEYLENQTIHRFFDNRHNNKNKHKIVNLETVISNPDEYIISECIPACKELWKKNIETYLTSDYNNNYLYILLNNLSKENIEIIEKLMRIDSRYYYDISLNKYGIRVKYIDSESIDELTNLVNSFVFQDTLRYQKVTDFVKSYQLEHPDTKEMNMFDVIRVSGKEQMYIMSEGKVYESKMYLDWHNRYEKRKDIQKDAVISFLGLSENNVTSDYAFIRDTYLEAERDYLLELSKNDSFASAIKISNEVPVDILMNWVNNLIEKVELNQLTDEEMASAEKYLMVYLAAIKDKVFNKRLKKDNENRQIVR